MYAEYAWAGGDCQAVRPNQAPARRRGPFTGVALATAESCREGSVTARDATGSPPPPETVCWSDAPDWLRRTEWRNPLQTGIAAGLSSPLPECLPELTSADWREAAAAMGSRQAPAASPGRPRATSP